jgi:SAM-dependent methyltransferase
MVGRRPSRRRTARRYPPPVAPPPRRLQFCLRNFQLDSRRILDVGCGPGRYLRHFGPGSVGLTLDPRRAQANGLDARQWEAREGIPPELAGEFDDVWCSALLEHVLRPHEFLIELRRPLRAGGRLFITVPNTVPLAKGPWRGFLAADHVNFFTARTLFWTMARAGYDLVFLGSPSLPAAPLWVASRLAPLGPLLLAVGVPIPDFQYPKKSHKRLVDGHVEIAATRSSR